MIFPILDGFLPFRKAPITWILVMFNVFMFSQNWELSNYCKEQFDLWYQDKQYLETQGRVYHQFKEKQDREIASLEDNQFLGRIAFKDEVFLQAAHETQWVGDNVAIRLWLDDLAGYLALREYYPAFRLGVSEAYNSPANFLSYQFFHEGFMHLFGNILLVMIIGGFLERRHSGGIVFFTYIFSGLFAATAYATIIGLNSAPLIGASGSLCGLIGFMLVIHFNHRTRLFYFILPKDGYYGFLKVRSFYWIVWLCILEDISGFLSGHVLYSGGVSHFVHLTGFLGGALVAAVYMQAIRLGEKDRLAAT